MASALHSPVNRDESADADAFARIVTAPPTDCLLTGTSQRPRGGPEIFVAIRLAEHCLDMAQHDPAASLRFCPEAHVLFADLSERQVPEMRYGIGDHGPVWARALSGAARICERAGLRDLALDLASWMGGVVETLVPYGLTSGETRQIVLDCLTRHVALLRSAGEAAAAARADQALTTATGLYDGAGGSDQ